MICCIDPAWAKELAAAWFRDNGELHSAELISKENFYSHHDLTIIEMPRIYASSLVDPNSIVKLGMGVGWAAGRSDEVKYVFPHEWKGSVDKDVMTARIEALLSKEELKAAKLPKAKGKRGDILDAIGIGLWHFKRLGQPTIRRGK